MRTAVQRHARTLPWQGRAALVALAMVGLVTLGSALSLGGDVSPSSPAGPPPLTADLGYWPTAPVQPATRPAPPSGSPTSPPPVAAGPGGGSHGSVPVTSVPANATPSPPTAAPSQPALRPGARVGLEPVTRPGFRVRHRDFTGRIDPIGPGSAPLEKADATFMVRAGLADSRCVSLEAVNFPGFYLRHQDFAIHLHRRDSGALFAADATFCPTGGRDVSLRSYNFPDRYVYHEWSRLYVGQPGDRGAMTFAVRSPW